MNVVADNNAVNGYTSASSAVAVASSPATRPYHHGNLRAALLARAIEVVDERGAATCRCASSPATSASATPPRAGTSPTARRCSTRSRSRASTASATDLRAAVDGAGAAFDARLEELARAYLAFATPTPRWSS